MLMRSLRWNAVDSAVDAVRVVIDAKDRKLAFEVKLVPEQYLVQQLFTNRSDHAFNEGVRTWREGHSLELFDLQNTQISEPTVEAEQGIVISGKALGSPPFCLGTVEHAAKHWTIDVATRKGKTDEAAAEDVDDDHHPEALQQNRFTTEEIQAPQTVLGVGEGGEPRGPLAMRETCLVLLQNAAVLSKNSIAVCGKLAIWVRRRRCCRSY